MSALHATAPPTTETAPEDGWAIRLSEGECTIIMTDARFSSDEEAELFVRDRAKEGSELHSYALQLCERS